MPPSQQKIRYKIKIKITKKKKLFITIYEINCDTTTYI
jgi:hypothetical protein